MAHVRRARKRSNLRIKQLEQCSADGRAQVEVEIADRCFEVDCELLEAVYVTGG